MRLFLLFSLALIVSAAPISAEKPDNEAFYLVGTMSDWNCHDLERNEFKLTDPDGDGIFTGSFHIKAGEMDFKVVIPPGRWDYGTAWGYPHEWEQGFVFRDRPLELELISNDKPYADGSVRGCPSITIQNWKGGTADFTLRWVEDKDGEWVPFMTLAGKEQPFHPLDGKLFLIGDFNSWQIPSASSDNGALPFGEATTLWDSFSFTQDFDFAAGELQLAICRIFPGTGYAEYFSVPSSYSCPFTLYKINDYNNDYTLQGHWNYDDDPRATSFTISDWKGGTFNINVNVPFSERSLPTTTLTPLETEITDLPEDLCLLFSRAGLLGKYPYDGDNFYCEALPGENVSVMVTTWSNNDDRGFYDPAECWGIPQSLEGAGFNPWNLKGRLPLVKGGQPISMFFEKGGKMKADFNWASSTVDVELGYQGGPLLVDKVYVCGYVSTGKVENNFLAPNEGNRALYDEYFLLNEKESGVFEGTYYLPHRDTSLIYPDNLPQFRFFSDLLGWTSEASLGSVEDDFWCVPVTMESGRIEVPITKHGLGNWAPHIGFQWPGGWVKLTVDANRSMLIMENASAPGAVESAEMDADSEKPLWYNLQGIQVAHPSKGLYIRKCGNESRLILLN